MKSQGGKIQIIAAILEGIGIVVSVIWGGFYGKETEPILGILIVILGVVVSIGIGTFLSGFGELVESAFEIKMNVYYMRKSQLEEKNNSNPNPNTYQNQMNNYQNF